MSRQSYLLSPVGTRPQGPGLQGKIELDPRMPRGQKAWPSILKALKRAFWSTSRLSVWTRKTLSGLDFASLADMLPSDT